MIFLIIVGLVSSLTLIEGQSYGFTPYYGLGINPFTSPFYGYGLGLLNAGIGGYGGYGRYYGRYPYNWNGYGYYPYASREDSNSMTDIDRKSLK